MCKHLCFEQETTTVDSVIRIHSKRLHFLVETSARSLLTLNLIHSLKKKKKMGKSINLRQPHLSGRYLSIAPKPCPIWERNHLEMWKYSFTKPTWDSNPLLLGL